MSREAGSGLYVALLRGINVGGKNKLAMKDLAAIFAAAGCTGVQTYVQSGNVVFAADHGLVQIDGLADYVSSEILRLYGLSIPVVLRSAEDLQRVLAENPFVHAGVAQELLHVYFLRDVPSASALESLDSNRSAGDTFVVSGGAIYLHLPNGVARTKLTNVYFDRMLGTVSTMRNWKTVTMLAGMVAAV